MDLLNPEIIKDEKKARVEEQITRSQEAGTEETRIMRKLNDAREFYESETVRMEAEHLARVADMEEKEKDLSSRVTSLENRRREALKPIKDLQTQAEEAMMKAKKAQDDVETRETALTAKENEIDRQMDGIADIKEDLRARGDRIKRREEGLEAAEVISAASQADLSRKWVAYHNAITVYNRSVETKELYLAEREAKCKVWEEALGVREADATVKEQDIQSRYTSLEAAEAQKKNND